MTGTWPQTYLDVVTSIFPDVKTEEDAHEMMWEKTCFPFMGNDWAHYQEQLLTLRKTVEAGLQPCEFCNEPGTERGPYTIVCDKCFDSPLFDSWKAPKLEVKFIPREKQSESTG